MAGHIRKIKNWLQFPKPFFLCLSLGDKIALPTFTALNGFLRIVSAKKFLTINKNHEFLQTF